MHLYNVVNRLSYIYHIPLHWTQEKQGGGGKGILYLYLPYKLI